LHPIFLLTYFLLFSTSVHLGVPTTSSTCGESQYTQDLQEASTSYKVKLLVLPTSSRFKFDVANWGPVLQFYCKSEQDKKNESMMICGYSFELRSANVANWGQGHNSIREVNITWIIRVWRIAVVCLDWGLQIAEQAWDPSSWMQLFCVCFELPLIWEHVAAGGIVRMHKKCWVWMWLECKWCNLSRMYSLYFILTWTLEDKSVKRFKYLGLIMLISPNIHEADLPVEIENQVVFSLSAYLIYDQTSIFGH